MNHTELAWEFAQVFDELPTEKINEMLAKNVPTEMLEFFGSYAETFGQSEALAGETCKRLPNLMLLGYLLRVLEERLIEDDSEVN